MTPSRRKRASRDGSAPHRRSATLAKAKAAGALLDTSVLATAQGVTSNEVRESFADLAKAIHAVRQTGPGVVLPNAPRCSLPFRGSPEVEALGDAATKAREDRANADEIIDDATADLDIMHGIRSDVVIAALEAAAERLRAEARARKAGR